MGTVRVAATRTPTKTQREEHDVSHVPYRPWCRFCVMGKGLERRHLTQSGDDDRPECLLSTVTSRETQHHCWLLRTHALARRSLQRFDERRCRPHAARLLAKCIDGLSTFERFFSTRTTRMSLPSDLMTLPESSGRWFTARSKS